MTSTLRLTCRLCLSDRLDQVLNLGYIPLGDDFVRADDLLRQQECYPVELMLCRDCGQVQLSNVVDPDAIYRDYVYTTGVSHGLTEHFHDYAKSAQNKLRSHTPGLVVEIGSNEGVMLRFFKERGYRVLGIDPAVAIAKATSERGIETWPFYFSQEVARRVFDTHGPAQLIIANNVLANIDDLDDVAEGIELLLAENGLFVFETSYLMDVVDGALLDTIFSEHVSYFSAEPLRKFFTRHGLELIDVERTSPKGGSLRGYVQRAGGPRNVSIHVYNLCAIETYLSWPDTYADMRARLVGLRERMLAIVETAYRAGRKIAAWGAADGPTTMIYYFGLAPFLDYIIDDNPVKIGTYSPGWHLPVLSSAALITSRPDMVVLLAWRYADEIMRAHRAYEWQWVLPLPDVKVIQ